MDVSTALRRLGASTLIAASLGASAVAQGQNATVTGTVTAETGQALEGANVLIEALSISVGTNAAGRYTIVVPAARITGQTVTLRVRAVGFSPQTRLVTLTQGATVTQNFILSIDYNRLSEVVVTGVTAGTEQIKVPFSVTKVDAASMPVPALNPLSQIQGKVAGATVVSGSGRPGAAPAIILRGPSSLNAAGRGQDPLYVIDGVIISGSLPDINPLDIESVEVVKGAAAASLYGSRAGNGVVQITTKSGRRATDGIQFGFRSEYGTSDIERDFGLARTHTLLTEGTGQYFCQSVSGQPTCARVFDYRREAARVNDAVGDFSQTPVGFPIDPGASTPAQALRSQFQVLRWPGKTYNAVDQVVHPRPFYQNNIDMSGRVGSTNVFASASAVKQGGAIRFLDGYSRQSARINVDQQVGDKVDIALRTYYNHSEEDGVNQDNAAGAAFFRLTRVPAIVNVLQRDTLGRLYVRTNLQSSGAQNENPLQSLENIDRIDITDRFIGGATVRYMPFDWADVEGGISYDAQRISYDQFQDKGFRTTQSSFTGFVGSIFQGTDNAENLGANAGVTVRHDFSPDLLTRFNVRSSFGQRDFDRRTLFGNTLAVQDVTNPGNATANQAITGFATRIRELSALGGVNVEYLERYIADAIVRRDGSSTFGGVNRWATYGRGSLAWRASMEPWWFAPTALNEFKLRASYGTAGNVPAFASQYQTFTITTGGIPQPVQLGNPFLLPEKITEGEVGADLEIFSRFGLNLTFARSKSEDQILPVPASSGTGYVRKWENAGTLETKTWEASLNIPILQRADFNWSSRVNWDMSRTLITQLNVPPFTFGATAQATENIFRAQVGERFGTFYGRAFITNCGQLPDDFQSQCGGGRAFQRNDDGYIVWVGEGNSPRDGITENLWQAQLPGSASPYSGVAMNWGMPIILRDETNNAARQVPLGHALPDYKLSMTHNVAFRKLSAYVLFDGSFGQSLWNQGRHWALLDYLSKEVDQHDASVGTAKPIGYYWRAAPPDQAGLGGLYDLLAPTNHTVEDASFVKLREMSLSYRLGPIANSGDWSISFVGRNLITWTDYTGFDPEVGLTGGQAASSAINAVDAFTFPNLRSYTVGLSTTF